MKAAPLRRGRGDFDSRTSRSRLLAALLAARTDRSLASTRARLIYVVERIHPVDRVLAEELCQLLPNSTDAEHPAVVVPSPAPVQP